MDDGIITTFQQGPSVMISIDDYLIYSRRHQLDFSLKVWCIFDTLIEHGEPVLCRVMLGRKQSGSRGLRVRLMDVFMKG